MAINRFNDQPSWLKVATTLEKPQTAPTQHAVNNLQSEKKRWDYSDIPAGGT